MMRLRWTLALWVAGLLGGVVGGADGNARFCTFSANGGRGTALLASQNFSKLPVLAENRDVLTHRALLRAMTAASTGGYKLARAPRSVHYLIAAGEPRSRQARECRRCTVFAFHQQSNDASLMNPSCVARPRRSMSPSWKPKAKHRSLVSPISSDASSERRASRSTSAPMPRHTGYSSRRLSIEPNVSYPPSR